MKLTKPPALPHYLQESFTRSTPIQKAIAERIEALENDKTPSDLRKDFGQVKRQFICAMAKKRLATPELQRMYIDALEQTRQVLSRPQKTDLEFDTFAALDQPEILEAYAKWEYPRGRRGFEANPTCSKALLSLMALGDATHAHKARMRFVAAAGMQQVFAAIEEKVAAIAGRDPKPCQTKEYTVCLDQIQALSSTGFDSTLIGANIDLIKAARDLFPNGEVAVYAAIDGTNHPAWVAQVGVGATEEDELRIRRRTPKAGARWIKGDNEIVVSGDDGDEVTIEHGGTFWRGYYLIALVCLKTGMPIVWMLRDANSLDDDPQSNKEADALQDLLKLLYEMWPDCPLKFVVGDKAWDFSEYYRQCLTQYGVHLVAVQRDDNNRLVRSVDQVDHKNIVEYTGRGEVYCRHHHDKTKYGPMTLAGYEFADRDGLAPGDTADLSKFRVRYRCEHCAKTYSLPLRGTGKNSDWNIFSFLPQSPLHLKRYALRRALETRRNTIESVFGALKTVSQLALQGPSRTRLTDFDTIATLVALSFTLRNAQVLAAERIRAEQYPAEFPADVLGGREMLTS